MLTRFTVGFVCLFLAFGAFAAIPGETRPIPGQYIVVLRDAGRPVPARVGSELTAKHGGQVAVVWEHAFRGFLLKNLPEKAVEALRRDSRIASIEPDLEMELLPEEPALMEDESSVMSAPVAGAGQRAAKSGKVAANTFYYGCFQTNGCGANGLVGWNLDRIDQVALPLNNQYSYCTMGENVDAYIIGTGVRLDHKEFKGDNGLSRIPRGYALDANGYNDCEGTGTRVASIVAGRKSGVAKRAQIIPVKVSPGCGYSTATSGAYVNGINWAIADHVAGKTAVAVFSFWWGTSISAINTATTNLWNDGVFVAAPGGHETSCLPCKSTQNACNTSPGAATAVMTVAASTKTDLNWPNTHTGSCIDIFAPGDAVVGAGINYDSECNSSPGWSGSIYAAAHVAGAAAILIQGTAMTPSQAATSILANATNNALTLNVTNPTVNKLLYTHYFWDYCVLETCSHNDPGPPPQDM
jgi:hypothetical protein